MSVPIDITDDTLASSLVPVQCASLAPPAEVLRLFRRYTLTHTHTCAHTHTHPAGAGSERQEEEKKRTQTTGQRPRQRREGKETNGPQEPTYTRRDGPNQHRALT